MRTVAERYLPFVRSASWWWPRSEPGTDFGPRVFPIAAAGEAAPFSGADPSAKSMIGPGRLVGCPFGAACLSRKIASRKSAVCRPNARRRSSLRG